MLKLAVIGAGAMGSLFGAKLSPLAEVWLVSRWEEQVAVIQKQGLRLIDLAGEEIKTRPHVTTNPAAVGRSVDLALICVKAPDTLRAAQVAARMLKPDGLAISLQNGLGNLELIASVLGQDRAVQGVTSHGATLLGAGRVRHAGIGPTYLANRSTLEGRLEAVQALFEVAGFETHRVDDLDALLWGKLIINVGINALTAILRVRTGVLARLPEAEAIVEAAVDEAVQIAQAKNISLPYDDPPAQLRRVIKATAANRASMLADVLRQAPTEIDVINGVIVREGRQLGIPTPVNQMLVWLVKSISTIGEQGWAIDAA